MNAKTETLFCNLCKTFDSKDVPKNKIDDNCITLIFQQYTAEYSM